MLRPPFCSGRCSAAGLLPTLLCLTLVGFSAGCTSPLFRGQSPELEPVDVAVEAVDDDGVRTVGDYARPYGMTWLPVEGVALVTQLRGTGSDPPPSPLRDELVKEMQTHSVADYSQILTSNDTSMVTVRGWVPPGAQPGDLFDVEVRIPPRSRTTSIRSGFLMRTRLRNRQVLGNALREGHVAGLAKGYVVVDALFELGDENVNETRGRVLGGGIVQRERPLGLFIGSEFASVQASALIGRAISNRFHHYDHGSKKGVANPTRDNAIELAVHPRYKHNLGRYLRVISQIAVSESGPERAQRMRVLERMLLEPTSAEAAALQLEAIGEESAIVLRKGLASPDLEVRFYAAEALAYLDDADAVDVLYAAARDVRAFRWRALTALSAMNSFQAQEQLARLTNEPSAETRYGAFRAMWMRNPRDPLIRGEIMGEHKFAFHMVSTKGEPMVHVSRSRRPEIVVFGHDLRLQPPSFLFAGKEIMIQQDGADTVRMTRYAPGKDDVEEVCSTRIAEVVRTIVKLGGGYSEVFEALEEARDRNYLAGRLEVDALPLPGREFRRHDDEQAATGDGNGDGNGDTSQPRPHVNNPIPDMFIDQLRSATAEEATSEDGSETRLDFDDEEEAPEKKEGFFGKISSWWSGDE